MLESTLKSKAQVETRYRDFVNEREDTLEGRRYAENVRLAEEKAAADANNALNKNQTLIDDPDKIGPGAEYNNQLNTLNRDITTNNDIIRENYATIEKADDLLASGRITPEEHAAVVSQLETSITLADAQNRELVDQRDTVQDKIDTTVVGTDYNNQQQGNYDPDSGLTYYNETSTDRDIDYNQTVTNQIGETDLPDNNFAQGTNVTNGTVVPDNGFDRGIDPTANYIDDVPTQTLDGTDFGKSDTEYRAENNYGLDRAIDPTSNYVDEQVYGPGGTIVPPSTATTPVTGGSTAPGGGGTGTPGAPTATKPAAPTSPAC